LINENQSEDDDGEELKEHNLNDKIKINNEGEYEYISSGEEN
jgi:hypothetical protein